MTAAATSVWTVARTDDRIVGALLIGVGMMLLSLALFSDGALIALALGLGSKPGPELLRDFRLASFASQALFWSACAAGGATALRRRAGERSG